MAEIGLRIDVDTLRGTQTGVPALLEILKKFNIKATFYFSVGPDNMGRHLWRLLKPAFFLKMMRSKAASLYGWDILLKGTFWQGPSIGKRAAQIIKKTYDEGHEVGLHAFDHYSWQMHIDKWSIEKIKQELEKGIAILEEITGKMPISSASPGWRCTEDVLKVKETFPFLYNTDCRGCNEFYPVINGVLLKQLQLPTTLPTYDELIGNNGITNENYNDYMLSLLDKSEPVLKILTIHAEVEGGICKTLFVNFLERAMKNGHSFVPLINIAKAKQASLNRARIIRGVVAGREGWVAIQEAV